MCIVLHCRVLSCCTSWYTSGYTPLYTPLYISFLTCTLMRHLSGPLQSLYGELTINQQSILFKANLLSCLSTALGLVHEPPLPIGVVNLWHLYQARRYIHMWAIGIWWFLDGTGVVGVVLSPFLKEEVMRASPQRKKAIFDGEGLMIVASKDVRGKEPPWCHQANQWWWGWWGHAYSGITHEGLLKCFLLLWGQVSMMNGNVQWDVRARMWTGSERGVSGRAISLLGW